MGKKKHNKNAYKVTVLECTSIEELTMLVLNRKSGQTHKTQSLRQKGWLYARKAVRQPLTKICNSLMD
jgi:hypothetical protein